MKKIWLFGLMSFLPRFAMAYHNNSTSEMVTWIALVLVSIGICLFVIWKIWQSRLVMIAGIFQLAFVACSALAFAKIVLRWEWNWILLPIILDLVAPISIIVAISSLLAGIFLKIKYFFFRQSPSTHLARDLTFLGLTVVPIIIMWGAVGYQIHTGPMVGTLQPVAPPLNLQVIPN